MILLTLPLGLVGGIWLVYLLGYKMSLAVAVGFIAAAGVVTEFGVVLLIYINQAIREHQVAGSLTDPAKLSQAVFAGTTRRLRPIMMTATVVVCGLLPIFVSHAAGSDVMKRIAAPFLGAMITAPLLSLVVLPIVYGAWRGRRIGKKP